MEFINNIGLVEDLGCVYPTINSKKRQRMGIFSCPSCSGPYRTTFCNIKRGASKQCKRCSATLASKVASENSNLKAKDSFITDVCRIHGSTIKVIGDYIDNKTKVRLLCNTCGISWVSTPSDIKQGKGCPTCALSKKITRVSGYGHKASERCKLSFANDIYGVHGDTLLVSSEYKNMNTKVNCICTNGHTWSALPSNLLQGRGCPACASYGFSPSKPAILYYLKIGNYYKIGVTNRSVTARFSNNDLEKIKLIRFWEYEVGQDALDLETAVKQLFRGHRYIGPPLLQSGNTEIFDHNILKLN